MARLPIPGQDEGAWGDILNEYLSQVHKADGSLKDNTVTSAALAPDAVDSTVVQDSSVTAEKIAPSAITEEKLDPALQTKLNTAAGVSDHGALTGLSDDDHPHYLDNTRGDARYYTKAQSDTQLGGKVGTNDARLSDARTPTTHAASHGSAGADPIAPSDIGAATSDDIADAISAHIAASNPHPVYLTQAEGDGRYVQTTDLTGYATDTELLDGLATKANTSHSHAISDVASLQTTLDGKASSSHNHAIGSLSGVTLTSPANGQVLKYNGTTWVNDDDLAGSGATNLGVIYASDDVTVTSSSGDDATIAAADDTSAGVMTSADKTKLDGIAAGAEVNAVTSVAGRTGAVTLGKTDVGLGNVPNTDATSRATHTGTQAASTISDFSEAVDDRVSTLIAAGSGITKSYDDTAGTLTISATGNTTAAQVAFTPDGDIAANDVQEAIQEVRDDTDTKLASKSNVGHAHDDRYYTEAETDTLLGGKSDTSHLHDDRYYTETEVDNLLVGKSNASHTHTANDLSDVTITSPSSGQVLKYNGTAWVNDTDNNAGTNLASSRNSTSMTVTSDTGNDATLAAADTTNAGVMSATDKSKLDGIATGATANSSDATLLSRANHTGTQTASTISDFSEAVDDRVGTLVVAGSGITKDYNDAAGTLTISATGDTNADQVTFTPNGDIAATDAQAAIQEVRDDTDTKLAGKSSVGHTHTIANVTGLQAALDGKAASSHAHVISDTTGLQTALDNKLDDSQRGAASGVASLDAGTKVPIAELPTGSTATTVSLGNHTHSNYQDTSQKGAASGYASLDSGTKVPVAQIPLSLGTVSLTDAATIATNASQGNHFRVTLGGNRTLGIPTNPTDGQRAIWEATASGADRTLTLTTGSSGSFELVTDITSPITITSGKTHFIGAIYNSSRSRWTVLASKVTA